MSGRTGKHLRRIGDRIARQGRAAARACFALTPHEQLAMLVVVGIILLGLATRFALRVLGMEF